MLLMSPENIFQLCSGLAMIGWIVLIVISPFWLNSDKMLIGIIVTLFAVVYTWLVVFYFNPDDIKKFGSLDGVMQLFQNKTLVTAGWVHYLAFDLMTGIWIKKNAQKHNMAHWIIIPCLLFTFMFGPMGLLFYVILRWAKTTKYFSANY
jgi:Domain of unknown function (DUF4281)